MNVGTEGIEFRVLKNFPTKEELKSNVAAWSPRAEVTELQYYWCLSYELEPSIASF